MYRQFRALADRYVFTPIDQGVASYTNNSIDQYETMEEALSTCKGKRIFLEPKAKKVLKKLPKGDIVIVIGNTNENNLEFSKEIERYSLNGPQLYGVNAAAVALWR